MKFLILEHSQIEPPANLLSLIIKNKYSYKRLALFQNQKLYMDENFDALIIVGGPMNIYEHKKYPWLKDEKYFTKKAIDENKKVLGICLGSQIIASALGAKVEKNKNKEIGWFSTSLTKEGLKSPFFESFPKNFFPLHWHGDTFSIPDGAKHLAFSEACKNQAFSYKNNVLALQFHLEFNEDNLKSLCKDDNDLLLKESFIQSPETILNNKATMTQSYELLELLFENFFRI